MADADYEKAKYDLEQTKENLENLRDEQLEALDKEIDRLDKIKSKYEDICDLISQSINEQAATEMFGEGWKDKVLSGNDDDIYNYIKDLHTQTEFQNDSLSKQIESNERIISQTQIIIDRFNAQEITLEEAKTAINNIVGLMQDGYTADEQLSTQLGLDQVNSIKEFQQVTSDKIAENMGLMNEYFTVANDNNLKIIEVMGTQTEKLEEIRKLDEENKRLYEEMLKKIEEMNKNYKSHSSGGGGSDGGGRDWGTGSQSTGIIESGMNGGHYSESHWDKGESPYSKDDDDDDEFHVGIKKGLVGKGDRSRTEFLQQIATTEMKPGERYIKALDGEAVFTEEQQNQLIRNYTNSQNFVPTNILAKPEMPRNLIPREVTRNIEVSFGDITLPNVKDGDSFVRDLERHISLSFGKNFSKVFR